MHYRCNLNMINYGYGYFSATNRLTYGHMGTFTMRIISSTYLPRYLGNFHNHKPKNQLARKLPYTCCIRTIFTIFNVKKCARMRFDFLDRIANMRICFSYCKW